MAEPSDAKGDTIWKPRLRRFQELQRHRIQHILLVSSLYDSFILSEDGHLNEALLRQFSELNLSQHPDLTHLFRRAHGAVAGGNLVESGRAA